MLHIASPPEVWLVGMPDVAVEFPPLQSPSSLQQAVEVLLFCGLGDHRAQSNSRVRAEPCRAGCRAGKDKGRAVAAPGEGRASLQGLGTGRAPPWGVTCAGFSLAGRSCLCLSV